jgi:hypothetical protein
MVAEHHQCSRNDSTAEGRWPPAGAVVRDTAEEEEATLCGAAKV